MAVNALPNATTFRSSVASRSTQPYRQGGDIGHPITVSEPESPPGEAFRDAARQCARRLAIDAVAKPRRAVIQLKQAR